ncbi:16S rRNA (uracil(1498)-N(3))-methyltransferase [Candidatus Pandoraea novymonadis]|uniref:Ribosomal RNA small subunit methyltransferase E n=1 Tax=Candidatus Pandoraea novymonadis TaxID=1808959 RepID=A0ABX5FFB9_9BURK|nr:16S rRNA (uracil(1498)-N(3))-methyltransferase [Candidatus Pandoraea novymonadis]PSB92409.1 Ribosomal RNA small subunit methyltransferase E [Candidatus Pandoraea novymonadis]
MPRFFIDADLQVGLPINLPGNLVHHIQVLRLQKGNIITLFSGTGGEYRAILLNICKKQATAQVIEYIIREAESPYHITLAQSIASGTKMDWIIEKAVELGVSAIQPLTTERAVTQLSGQRAIKRVTHWQNLVRAACEQCGRNRIPSINPIQTLTRWLSSSSKDFQWRILLSPKASEGFEILPIQAPHSPGVLLFGPEGGLSEAEESASQANGFTCIHLGARILRTETASVAVLAALAARWGGW